MTLSAAVRRVLVAGALVALLAAGCGDDGSGDSGGSDDTTAEGGDGGGELSSYETVADLNADLGAAGITCELEYEGLADATREISQCTLEGEAAILTIWYDEELLGEVVDPAGGEPAPATAYGANWTVEVETAPTAAAVADAAGGTTTDI